MNDLDKIKSDFRYHMQAMWQCHNLYKVAPLEEVDFDMASWLQHGPDSSIALGFRGQGKSYKTDCYVTWYLMNNPSNWVMLASASEKLAKQNLHLIKNWVQSTPWLRHLVPRKGSKERDGAIEYDVAGNNAKNPSVTAVGITGQLPGRRAHLIIADDVETYETALTLEQRARLRIRVKEFESIIVPGGQTKYLMTPQHLETIALPLTKQHGYAARSWPARYPKEDEFESILGLSPTLKQNLKRGLNNPGDPTCPIRFNNDTLIQKEAKSGRSYWLQQFQLHVGDAELTRCPLRLSDLIVYPVNPDKAPITIQWGKSTNQGSTAIQDIESVGLEGDALYGPIFVDTEKYEPYHCTKMFIDPAGRGADENAWCIIGELFGKLWVKKIDAYTGGHNTENVDRMCHQARQYGVNDIYVEQQFGGEVLAELLRTRLGRLFVKPGENKRWPDGWSCNVETVRSTGQKEVRMIETVEPAMNQHRVIIDPEVAKDEKFCVQLTQVTRLRGCLQNDDRLDCFSGCVRQFTDYLDQDDEAQASRVKDESITDEELERFNEEFGFTQEHTWIHV